MLRSRLLLITVGFAAVACARSSQTALPTLPAGGGTVAGSIGVENPLFRRSPLQYEAPPFDRIHIADFQPALEEGMKQNLTEITQVAEQSAPPTFENTIVAMEHSGPLLTRSASVFFMLTGANTNDTLQKIDSDVSPKLAAHRDAIYLNGRLFGRVKSIYDRRDALGLDADQKFLVERYYRDFVRAGALLSEADKTRMRALNQEEAKLGTDFDHKLLAATKVGALVIDDKTQLAGLSDAEIAAAAEAAKTRGLEGKWVIVLQNTTQQPAQASLSNRAVRQRLFEASIHRADRGDTNDTRAIIRRLAQLRAERAKLLGFPTFAAYTLTDKMAKTPETALRLLSDLVPAATARARAEAADMQALIDKQKGGFTLAPWDWQYYAEQVRKAQYNLDESQIKPYFELDRVLRDGVFFAAGKLYGLTFTERHDIPVYQPDVRVFEVFDVDGKSMALFYCDYFKRDNKSGGAWMGSFVDQSGLLGTKPVIYNVANFEKPAPGQPALLDLAWHNLPADAPQQDVDAFEADALKRFKVDLAVVPPRYHSTYFAHIWGGYSAGYYSYLWSEVLDDDAYQWFVENGGMTRQNGQRFRDMILSRGGTSDAAEMYRAFRGRDPSVEPLLEQRGLKATPQQK